MFFKGKTNPNRRKSELYQGFQAKAKKRRLLKAFFDPAVSLNTLSKFQNIEYLSEIEVLSKNAMEYETGAWGGCLTEEPWGKRIS